MRNLFFILIIFLVIIYAVFLVLYLKLPPNLSPYFSEKNLKEEILICFGNSLTEGVGANPEESYPAVLQKMVPFKVINAGRSGDTTFDALKRLETDVLNLNPKIVILEFGANDFFRRTPVTEVESNLITLINKIKEKKSLVILAGVHTSPQFNRMFKRVSKKTQTILIPDILKDVFAHPDLMSDPFHPNSQGYQIVAQNVYQGLYKCLKKAGFPNIIPEKF